MPNPDTTPSDSHPDDFVRLFGQQKLVISRTGDLSMATDTNAAPASRHIDIEVFPEISGGHLRLPDVRTPLGALEYTVRTGPIPVFRPYDSFCKGLDPLLWGHYLTGMSTRIHGTPTRQPNGWRGKIHETVSYVVGSTAGNTPQLVENILAVDFQSTSQRTSAQYSLERNLNNILIKNEGAIVATPSLGGFSGSIFASKTIALAPNTPYDKLAPFIPAILEVLLSLWMWEYAAKLALFDVPPGEASEASLGNMTPTPGLVPPIAQIDFEFDRAFRRRFGDMPSIVDSQGRFTA